MQIQIQCGQKTYNCKGKDGETVLSVLQQNGIAVQTPCGGNGRCQKCIVEIDGKPYPACQTMAFDGMKVVVPEEKKAVIAETGKSSFYPPDLEEGYFAACDIGTTTVVCHLLDKAGKKLATASACNSQRESGADIVSRIHAPLSLMHEQMIAQIQNMLLELLHKTGKTGRIKRLAVSGNTVMCHLFAGVSAESIGTAPFVPQEFFGKEYEGEAIGLSFCDRIYILPAVSGFVGGDITADLLSVMPEHEREETLLLDIGTNGEIVLGQKGSFLCCATAAGPAFEGAEITMGMPAQEGAVSHVYLDKRRLRIQTVGNQKEEGICGSGLLDALAVFLQMGIVDKTGMIENAVSVSVAYRKYIGEYEGQSCIWLTPELCITQDDIRKLQLAKAALSAGIEILMHERNIRDSDIRRVVLAGGFGNYLNPESAVAIGLIPASLLTHVEAAGNAAGEGAASAAISKQARKDAQNLSKTMHYIELSRHPMFPDIYMKNMNFI